MASLDLISPSKPTVNKRTSGGRHRKFSTEQRKDRNRQAQAAFRERRSENTKTQNETILKLQSMVEKLQQSTLQANERADKAEQRYKLLQDEYHKLNSTLGCFLTQPSPPPYYTSPLPLQPSTVSPVMDFVPMPLTIYQQEAAIPLDTSDLTTSAACLLLDEWNHSWNDGLPTKSIPVNILDESKTDDPQTTPITQLPLIGDGSFLV